MNLTHVGEGKVSLIAGGGKVYTDIAARFTRTEKSLDEIISTPYDQQLVNNIVESGHKAAVEFDYFIFGIEGFARVTEVQLVRKRLASFLIKSGRPDKKGKRSYDVVVPESIMSNRVSIEVPSGNVSVNGKNIIHYLGDTDKEPVINIEFDTMDILHLLEDWYNHGVIAGYKEEELRYLKPQATEFKAIIGMNAHALMDWFMIRLCKNAQTEIRDLALKMFVLCRKAAPDLFAKAGPSCVVLGYCPENRMQNKDCKVIRKDDAIKVLSNLSRAEIASILERK